MAVILPALAEIKTDLLLKFCPKDRIKELENKIFALEESNARGLSKKESELHEQIEMALAELQQYPVMLQNL